MTPDVPSASLAVDAISKRYGETVALDGVSIDFRPGSVHTILGENGSGKSTLVKLLSGVVFKDSGRLLVDDVPFEGRTPAQFSDRGFATVFQEVLIAPDRTVTDNVLLGMDRLFVRTVPRQGREARVAEMLKRIAVSAVPPDALAGRLPLAQQQLVVIARALVRDPRILILDEATAALDHADREAVFVEVERRARAGGLVLFISHRMDEVFRLSDRISVLRSGRLVKTLARGDATTDELLALMAPVRPPEAHHG